MKSWVFKFDSGVSLAYEAKSQRQAVRALELDQGVVKGLLDGKESADFQVKVWTMSDNVPTSGAKPRTLRLVQQFTVTASLEAAAPIASDEPEAVAE